MKKQLLVMAVVIGAALLGAAGQAGAAPGIGGCGTSKDLLSNAAALGRVDIRIYDAAGIAELAVLIETFVDANDDGHVCVKQFAPNRGQDMQWGAVDYVITQLSDNVAQGR